MSEPQKNEQASESALNALLDGLAWKGYRNHGKQVIKSGELWQKKHDCGCFFNFWVHKKETGIPVDMASAEIIFKCSEDGQWCQHTLYGLPVEILANQIDLTEMKLLKIFELYNGNLYI